MFSKSPRRYIKPEDCRRLIQDLKDKGVKNINSYLKKAFDNCLDCATTDIINPFQDATVAYSLRDLDLGVTSNVVRVRRSSDNLEQDFTTTQVTDGTLTSFCGAGDGFVSVWYDQTGAYDASQTNASSQPKIVNSGNLIFRNGKPSLYTSINGAFLTASSQITAPVTVFLTLGNDKISGINLGIFGKWNKEYAFLTRDLEGNISTVSKNSSLVQTSTTSNISLNTIQDNVFTVQFLNSLQRVYKNGNQIISATIENVNISSSSFSIGSYQNTLSLAEKEAYLQDFIVFSSDKSAERPDIETNINDHYAIY